MSPTPPSPEDQLAAARGGSREALGELLEAYRQYLLNVAHGLMDQRLTAKGGASDLVQETFSDAHRDFGRFHGSTEAELVAWLRQVLNHHVIRFARQYRDTQKRSAGREIPFDAFPAEDGDIGLPAGGMTPSAELIADERNTELQAAIARLPEDYRRVILFRYRDDLGFEEIGRALGRSAEAVRKLWVRAVERLNLELEGRE